MPDEKCNQRENRHVSLKVRDITKNLFSSCSHTQLSELETIMPQGHESA